jgi:hypothetical protein
VFKPYLPRFSDEVSKLFLGCKVELSYDPTEPNEREVKEFGFEKAKVSRTHAFYNRAERMRSEAWPKGAAFYSHFIVGV